MSTSFGRNIFSKLSLKSSQSEPIFTNKEKQTSPSLSLHIKSTVALNNRLVTQQSQQHLDAMHKLVDRTDHDLRHALEQAANRREQLDDLHFRSEEMLSKNENLVFGIANYRKTQERDLFWQRLRYSALGTITIGIVILIIILSMSSKPPISPIQVIDVRHPNQDVPSTMQLSAARRKRKILHELLTSKSVHFV